MNSYMIATVSLIAAAVLIATTIAVPVFSNSAHTIRNGPVAQNAQNEFNGNQKGLVNANVGANIEANRAVNVLSDSVISTNKRHFLFYLLMSIVLGRLLKKS
jgi:hypothetical protein